ncbi:MAG: prolyl oligopeptidase family serine peptidase [Rudaea sp.]|uniref:S9 family peptidase n=1 Tax=Rudaea sp. TaxID=2136325 RepID=UPI0039E64563
MVTIPDVIPRTTPLSLVDYFRPQWLLNGKTIIVPALSSGVSISPSIEKLAGKARNNESSVSVYSTDDTKQESSVLDLYEGDLVAVDTNTRNYVRVSTNTHLMSFKVSPDGQNVAYTDLLPLSASSAPRIFVALKTVNLTTHLVQVLNPKLVQWASPLRFSWSPDSNKIAIFDSGMDTLHECFVIDVRNGFTKHIGGDLHSALLEADVPSNVLDAPVWRSSTEILALIGGTKKTLWRIDIRGAATASIVSSTHATISALLATNDAARSDRSAKNIVVQTYNSLTDKAGFGLFDKSNDRLEIVYEDRVALDGLGQLSNNGRVFVFAQEASDYGPQLWVSNSKLQHRRQLTSLNKELNHYDFGSSQHIRWTAPSGGIMDGALLLPPGYVAGKPYPLIVKIYGGSHDSPGWTSVNTLNTFGLRGINSLTLPYENLHMFATRGYAVLYADTEARVGTPMSDIAASLLPGVDKLISEKVADPERLGIMGHSYGGYGVLSVLVQSGRFRAAVVSAGIGNLIESYGGMSPAGVGWRIGWVEGAQGRMGGSLWSVRDRYIANSPLFFLDRVTTPVLLIQGTADTAVAAHESDEVYLSLRRLGKEATYIKYSGEGHSISGTEDMRDMIDRMTEWFDRYLREKSSVN